MGFNIGICAITDKLEITSKCDEFLERNYFNWVTEYEYLDEDSCIIQTGKLFNLDLEPLTYMTCLEGYENDEIPECLQDVNSLIITIDKLISCVKEKPFFINELPNVEHKSRWNNYIIKGDFLIHLETISRILNCYKNNGFEKVFFEFG